MRLPTNARTPQIPQTEMVATKPAATSLGMHAIDTRSSGSVVANAIRSQARAMALKEGSSSSRRSHGEVVATRNAARKGTAQRGALPPPGTTSTSQRKLGVEMLNRSIEAMAAS